MNCVWRLIGIFKLKAQALVPCRHPADQIQLAMKSEATSLLRSSRTPDTNQRDTALEFDVTTLKDRQVTFRSLTEGMDTTTASGELLFHVFGALAQYELALIQEWVIAGLAVAKRRSRIGGRPAAIVGEKRDAIIAALNCGMSKAAERRTLYRQTHHAE
ncbi:hypothetical protein Bpro_5525 (plasmid) [Polaromonas sp. JS666]|nr:hypothetical protein Bpro_5525 [Polaromonas sp. JS666]